MCVKKISRWIVMVCMSQDTVLEGIIYDKRVERVGSETTKTTQQRKWKC